MKLLKFVLRTLECLFLVVLSGFLIWQLVTEEFTTLQIVAISIAVLYLLSFVVAYIQGLSLAIYLEMEDGEEVPVSTNVPVDISLHVRDIINKDLKLQSRKDPNIKGYATGYFIQFDNEKGPRTFFQLDDGHLYYATELVVVYE